MSGHRAFSNMPSQGDDAAAGSEEKPSGLFGRMFGKGKSFKKAKMGQELSMYYNEEVSSR